MAEERRGGEVYHPSQSQRDLVLQAAADAAVQAAAAVLAKADKKKNGTDGGSSGKEGHHGKSRSSDEHKKKKKKKKHRSSSDDKGKSSSSRHGRHRDRDGNQRRREENKSSSSHHRGHTFKNEHRPRGRGREDTDDEAAAAVQPEPKLHSNHRDVVPSRSRPLPQDEEEFSSSRTPPQRKPTISPQASFGQFSGSAGSSSIHSDYAVAAGTTDPGGAPAAAAAAAGSRPDQGSASSSRGSSRGMDEGLAPLPGQFNALNRSSTHRRAGRVTYAAADGSAAAAWKDAPKTTAASSTSTPKDDPPPPSWSGTGYASAAAPAVQPGATTASQQQQQDKDHFPLDDEQLQVARSLLQEKKQAYHAGGAAQEAGAGAFVDKNEKTDAINGSLQQPGAFYKEETKRAAAKSGDEYAAHGGAEVLNHALYDSSIGVVHETKQQKCRPNQPEQSKPGAVRVRGTDEEDPAEVSRDYSTSNVYGGGVSSSHPTEENGVAMDPRHETHVHEGHNEQQEQQPQHNHGIVAAYEVEEPSVIHEAKIVNETRQKRLRYILIAAIVIVLVVAVVVPVMVTTQGSTTTDTSSAITFQVMVADLCSPRHLKVQDGKLYIAEAGVGPVEIAGDRETETLCLPSTLRAIPGGICFGNTGQVSVYDLVSNNMEPPALSGLFSARPTEGSFTNQVYGAHAVDFQDGDMYTLLGLGYVHAPNVSLEDPSLIFASILKNEEAAASPWVPLYENNYANVSVVESNPFHMCIHDGTTYAVDAGADLLYTYLNIDNAGMDEPDSVVVLPKIDNVPAVEANPRGGPCNNVEPPRGPSFCGQYQDNAGNWLYSANAVPTVVRVNPATSKLYVGYLGGAIWNEPVSGIFVMDLDRNGIPLVDTIQVMRGGNFWAIVDFDFYQGDMFILETNPGGFVPFEGRVSRVTLEPDGFTMSGIKVITDDLFQPVSITVHEDTIYLANNTFNMGIDDCNGHILRADLN